MNCVEVFYVIDVREEMSVSDGANTKSRQIGID